MPSHFGAFLNGFKQNSSRSSHRTPRRIPPHVGYSVAPASIRDLFSTSLRPWVNKNTHSFWQVVPTLRHEKSNTFDAQGGRPA